MKEAEVPVRVTASQLRADIYNLLDRVLETGESLEIERSNGILRVVVSSQSSWLDRLPRRAGVVDGDPEDLVHVDWSSECRPDPLAPDPSVADRRLEV